MTGLLAVLTALAVSAAGPSTPPPANAPPQQQSAGGNSAKGKQGTDLDRQLSQLERQTSEAADTARQAAQQLAQQAGDELDRAQEQVRQSLPQVQKQIDRLGQSLQQLRDALDQPDRRVTGVVNKISPKEIAIAKPSGEVQSFRLDPRSYAVDGAEEVGVDQVKPGAEVRVTFVLSKGAQVAREIEVLRAQAPAPKK